MAFTVSTPRFPAASKKRGMPRAIEIVEWMKAFALARASESQSPLVGEVWRTQASHYEGVLEALRSEV